MASLLEQIPRDVLQLIAFLTATSSPLDPPTDLGNLLLTNSAIRRSLSVEKCPHLYANIFRAKFTCTTHLHSLLTDTVLAAELLDRCRVLRRARRRDISPHNSRQELWAAIRIIVEDDGLNRAHLARCGFSDFIMSFARARLTGVVDPISDSDCEINALAIWLLCCTASHDDLVNLPETTRQDMRNALVRYAVAGFRVREKKGCNYAMITTAHMLARLLQASVLNFPQSAMCLGERRSSRGDISPSINSDGSDRAMRGIRQTPPACPDPTTAAIILVFAFEALQTLVIPPHVPENRAAAIAAERSGPTMEDFRAMVACRAPLFAELLAAAERPSMFPAYAAGLRHFKHDVEFCRAARDSYGLPTSPTCFHTPGTLTGVWEGTYMLSSMTEPKSDHSSPSTGSGEQYRCLKPMQCAISEYFCYSPHVPFPPDEPFVSPSRVPGLEHGDDFEARSRGLGYEKYTPNLPSDAASARDPNEALDVVIVGETLHDHEQAWGGYKFAGRVRRDGMIVIKRKPKHADEENLGTWIFEGYLRYGVAFVGQVRSSVPVNNGHPILGIFSLHKVCDL